MCSVNYREVSQSESLIQVQQRQHKLFILFFDWIPDLAYSYSLQAGMKKSNSIPLHIWPLLKLLIRLLINANWCWQLCTMAPCPLKMGVRSPNSLVMEYQRTITYNNFSSEWLTQWWEFAWRSRYERLREHSSQFMKHWAPYNAARFGPLSIFFYCFL